MNFRCSNLSDQTVNASIGKVKKCDPLQRIVLVNIANTGIFLVIHITTEAQCPIAIIRSELRIINFQIWHLSQNFICQLTSAANSKNEKIIIKKKVSKFLSKYWLLNILPFTYNRIIVQPESS